MLIISAIFIVNQCIYNLEVNFAFKGVLINFCKQASPVVLSGFSAAIHSKDFLKIDKHEDG